MARVLVVGAEVVTAPWALALRGDDHLVEHCADVLAFQDRFGGDAIDILVVDITNADHGEAMLMVQVQSVWPDCRVIAVPRDRSYRNSALYQMGLWSPDRLLMQPVKPETLRASVRQLCMQARINALVRTRRAAHEEAARPVDSVVLSCGATAGGAWAVKPN